MSASGPRREVAFRLFADEFNDASYTYAESDEERAPKYLVTPTGARVNRLFVVGVLTEVEEVSDDVVRARVVDPTGAFVIYAGQYQPEALAFFERADPPVFVALTGKARTFQPDGSDRVFTSIRPESVNEVDAETRDRWVVQTAEHTLERVAIMAKALSHEARGDGLKSVLQSAGVKPGLAAGMPRAIDEYGTTTGYLASIQEMAVDAARLVAGEIDAVDRADLAPEDGGEAAIDTSFADDVVLKASADAGTDAEPEPEATTEPDVEPVEESDTTADTSSEPESDESPVEPEPEPDVDETPDTPTAESEPASEPTADEPVATDADLEEDVETTDEMYELSEEERAEVEENFDVGFESGAEIGEPGEAGNAPDPEEMVEEPDAEAETEPSEPESEAEEAPAEGTEAATEEPNRSEVETVEADGEDAAEAGGEEETGDEDVEVEGEETEDDEVEVEDDASDASEAETADEESLSEDELEDVVIETMKAEGGSDGIERAALVSHVQAEYDVAESAIEDAIQSALLGGRCFESGDDALKPI